jgi:hypothetical protein
MDEILNLHIGFDEVSSKTSDDYYTPKWIFEAIGLEFDLDVAAPPNGIPWIPAKRHFTVIDDGLAQEWSGRVWMNPPYSDVTPWAKKFIAHNNGIALVQISKARWFNILWEQTDAMLVLPSNLRFTTAQGESKGIFMPCVLAAMGPENVAAIRKSELGYTR